MAKNNGDRDNQNSDKRDEPVVAVPVPINNSGSGYVPAVIPVAGSLDKADVNDVDAERSGRAVGSVDDKPSNDYIRQEVNDHLVQHNYIDATEVVVSVKDGEVTLEGSVPDDDQKKYAEEVAQKVAGVKQVRNLLKIKKPQSTLTQNTTGKQ